MGKVRAFLLLALVAAVAVRSTGMSALADPLESLLLALLKTVCSCHGDWDETAEQETYQLFHICLPQA
jgi:hypothetical protein